VEERRLQSRVNRVLRGTRACKARSFTAAQAASKSFLNERFFARLKPGPDTTHFKLHRRFTNAHQIEHLLRARYLGLDPGNLLFHQIRTGAAR
jgi:hypothetical protein